MIRLALDHDSLDALLRAAPALSGEPRLRSVALVREETTAQRLAVAVGLTQRVRLPLHASATELPINLVLALRAALADDRRRLRIELDVLSFGIAGGGTPGGVVARMLGRAGDIGLNLLTGNASLARWLLDTFVGRDRVPWLDVDERDAGVIWVLLDRLPPSAQGALRRVELRDVRVPADDAAVVIEADLREV